MRSTSKILFVIVSFIVLSCYAFIDKNGAESGNDLRPKPKPGNPVNVIVMIGDGMGLSQVSAALYYQKERSNFERFPVTGLSKTSSSSDKITDSAAGATAMACGEKTYNGAIGVDDQGKPIGNIVEELSKLNYNTGLIATSAITHATPAGYFAHVKSRHMQEEIASQLVTSDVDFFSGGGLKFFNERSDGLNAIDELKSNGFDIKTDGLFVKKDLKADGKYGMLLAKDGMPTMVDGRGDFLSQSVELSLDYFEESEKPFFMMVEGSQIDWGGHGNNAGYLISELLDFDHAIGVVLDYAKRHPNTLVVVTADHETGGFTLASKDVVMEDGQTGSDYNTIDPSFSTGGHSATMVPVFAYGPGSEKFSGIFENTDIYRKIVSIVEK